MSEKTRIGLVGTGFARRVMLPAFAAGEGAQVVAVCSASREHAEAAAQEYGIHGIYTDYEAMLEEEELDLVAIVTPPHLHKPIALAALRRKRHVLCEKPTALNLEEAREMYNAAKHLNVLHVMDHELRFHPTLLKLKELVDSGYLGDARSVSFSVRWGYPMDPNRPWGWWFDEAKGGGLLGALGSHQIDLLRWLLGEFRRVSGHLHTFVQERPLPHSPQKRAVTSDEYCAFMAELESGAIGSVVLDATARVKSEGERWLLAFHGQSGSLFFDGQLRLWGMRDQSVEEFTQRDDAENTPGVPEGLFARSFVHFSRRIVEALQSGRITVPGAATFYDGMRVQAVLDAVRLSQRQARWVDCPSL
jgi:predicted dehydrogenase